MSGTYFVVDHVSDPAKVDGLVESYQMVPVQYEQEDGSVISGFRRVNFVHWPSLPTPFVHEEWSEDLSFANIYDPSDDTDYDGDDDEDEDEDYGDDEDEAGEEQSAEAEG